MLQGNLYGSGRHCSDSQWCNRTVERVWPGAAGRGETEQVGAAEAAAAWRGWRKSGPAQQAQRQAWQRPPARPAWHRHGTAGTAAAWSGIDTERPALQRGRH